MVRSANLLWAIFCAAPVLYIIIAAQITLEGRGLSTNQTFISTLFLALIAVSIANGVTTVLIQMKWRPTKDRIRYDPLARVYFALVIGAILSEAHSIYGLVLTLLSGSILYLIGFSIAAWASLLWVRARFKQNLANIPS